MYTGNWWWCTVDCGVVYRKFAIIEANEDTCRITHTIKSGKCFVGDRKKNLRARKRPIAIWEIDVSSR